MVAGKGEEWDREEEEGEKMGGLDNLLVNTIDINYIEKSQTLLYF